MLSEEISSARIDYPMKNEPVFRCGEHGSVEMIFRWNFA